MNLLSGTAYRRRLTLYLTLVTLAISRGGWCQESPSPPSFPETMTAFVAARNAYLLTPEGTADGYRELMRRYTRQVKIGELTLDELAQGTFEGLFDNADIKEAAANRAAALAKNSGTKGESARAAAIRLRLLGDVTLNGVPAPSTQERLILALFTNSGFSELIASSYCREAALALVGVGRTEPLRSHHTEVDRLFALLPAGTHPQMANELDALTVIALVTGPNLAAAQERLRILRAFAASLTDSLPESAKKERQRQVERIDRILAVSGTSEGQFDRENLSLAGLENVLSQDSKVYAQFLQYLANTAEQTVSAGGELTIQFILPKRESRTVFRLPDSYYVTRRESRFSSHDVVTAESGKISRAFGGLTLDDPSVRFRATDIGLDTQGKRGFARDFQITIGGAEIRANNLSVSPLETALTRPTVLLRLGGLELARIVADRLDMTPDGTATLQEVQGKLFGMTVYRKKRLPLQGAGAKGEGQNGADSAKPHVASAEENAAGANGKNVKQEGRSPALQLLKPPSLGTFEGNLSLSYYNAIKFGGPYTAVLAFRTYGSKSPSLYAGLNYNLRTLTNETDNFIDASSLQEDSRGSFFFNIGNQTPALEDKKLRDPTLFIGAYTSQNQYYKAPDQSVNRVSLPLTLGVEGGGAIGRNFGYRLQTTYGSAEDGSYGSDTRLSVMGIMAMTPVEITRGVNLTARVEGISRIGSSKYAWFRALVGPTALLLPGVRLSAAYFRSWEDGVARFPYDRVAAGNYFSARADFDLTGWKLSYLNLYDVKNRQWYRSQWYVGRKFNYAELYTFYDQKFASVSFGFNVHLSTIFDLIARRRLTGVEMRR